MEQTELDPNEIIGEACRRMAAQHYQTAEDARYRAMMYRRYAATSPAKGGGAWPMMAELAEQRLAEAEGLGDVYAWYYARALGAVSPCHCRDGMPCPDYRGRDLLKLPRVTYLTTTPERGFTVEHAWHGPPVALDYYVPKGV